MTPNDPRDNDDGERELLEASIPLAAAGRRFDQVLAELFPDYSRSRLTEWIKSGDALLGGRVVRPRESVRGGEAVALLARPDIETDAEPEDIPLDVLYADADVLVVNKPAGLVVHPGAGNPRGRPARLASMCSSALTIVPLSLPGAGCMAMPAGLLTTIRCSSS